jgi:hypothetical protein
VIERRANFVVHWTLTEFEGDVETYWRQIAWAWTHDREYKDERRLSCDYSGQMIIAHAQVHARDVVDAIQESRVLVIDPFVRARMPLPAAASVVVAARPIKINPIQPNGHHS